jgi:hypothetical protein
MGEELHFAIPAEPHRVFGGMTAVPIHGEKSILSLTVNFVDFTPDIAFVSSSRHKHHLR